MNFRRLWVLLAGVACALLVLFKAAGAAAPAAPVSQIAPATTPRTITVVGQGTTRVAPDTAEAVIGVDFVAATPQEALEQAGVVVAAVQAALIDLSIPENEIQPDNFNLYPVHSNGANAETQQPAVYRVSYDIRVIIRDPNLVGTILAAAIEAGANTIRGVKFGVEDISGAEAEARQKAIASAQDRADALAVLTGVQIGRVHHITEVVNNQAIGADVVCESREEQPNTPIFLPDPLSVTVQVQLTYTVE